jgi:hypothetical protein
MLADLAISVATALLGAAATDTWTVARVRLIRLVRTLGGSGTRHREDIRAALDETAAAFRATPVADQDRLRRQLLPGWTAQLSDLLDDHPGLAPDLRALVHELDPRVTHVHANTSRDRSVMYVSQGSGPVTHLHGSAQSR